MTSIKSKREEIDALKAKMSGRDYFARKAVKFREWDVLTRVFTLLEGTGEEIPAFASEHESPDFQTFGINGITAAAVEITEVVPPKSRRFDFWRRQPQPKAQRLYPDLSVLSDPWATMRKVILSKAKKGYAQDNWLFIYCDLPMLVFEDWRTPFHEQLLDIHSREQFDGLDQFGRVLVLSADMKGLVELHPNPRVIVPSLPFISE